jgi:peptide/nickel transport system substrate-binding protein
MTQPDPTTLMRQFLTSELSSKENKWQGRNITRWTSAEYDKLYADAEGELDPVKRAAMFIRMNDLAVGDHAVIPVVFRPRVAAVSSKMRVDISGWDNDMGNLKDWYREG